MTYFSIAGRPRLRAVGCLHRIDKSRKRKGRTRTVEKMIGKVEQKFQQ